MYNPSTDQLMQYPPRPMMAMDRPWKANIEVAPNCPRCASTNTKFCYYNNYSLTQPRYFCKGCRRYWTKGGTLRNVPVGGGCRKSRRARSRNSSMSRGLHGSDGRSTNDQFLNSSSDSDCSKSDPVDIDLAAVFAKFLNPNTSSDKNQKVEGSDKFANSESDNTGTIESQCQEQFDLVEGDASLLNEIPHMMVDDYNQQEGRIEGIVDCEIPSSLDGYKQHERRIEEMIDYDIPSSSFNNGAQDVFWSDTSDAAAYSSYPWQPMAPLQEFDSQPITLQDQSTYTTSTDLLNDNWSCFDLPVCEVFLRP